MNRKSNSVSISSLAQSGDGSWSLQSFPGATKDDIGTIRSDTAATALSLLSFLGGGFDHYGDRYQVNVAGGLRFLVQNQKPNGDLYLATDAKWNESAWLYSHAMGTIALCEAYGMTGDEKLREPAQKALDFIVRAKASPKEAGVTSRAKGPTRRSPAGKSWRSRAASWPS
ncbi:MAG: hypothetical protein QM811_27930 [Pirellulales bacterium]